MIGAYILGYSSLVLIIAVATAWLLEECNWVDLKHEDRIATIIGVTICVALVCMVVVGMATLIGIWIS
jgi:hypothetical protein